jgi:hypothetical protein
LLCQFLPLLLFVISCISDTVPDCTWCAIYCCH